MIRHLKIKAEVEKMFFSAYHVLVDEIALEVKIYISYEQTMYSLWLPLHHNGGVE